MITSNSNLLILITTDSRKEKVTEQELSGLNAILSVVQTPEQFCKAHELVNRNRITSRKNKILKETKHYRMRPFRFLINKN